MRKGMTEAEPFRRAFEVNAMEQGLTASEVARRLGWVNHQGFPDSQRVRRTLGLAHRSGWAKTPYPRHRGKGQYITLRNAHALMLAMNCDPIDVGL